MSRTALVPTLFFMSIAVTDAAAQRTRPEHQPTNDSVSGQFGVTARLGSRSYSSTIPGSCKHEPSGSIYDVPAALWLIEGSGSERSEIKQLNLTLWRPKNGSADQISLFIDTGSGAHRIELSPRRKPSGSAIVRLQPQGPGGRLELSGKDSSGVTVNLTISCPTFEAVEAAGG
jgi:hypothetical protein